MIIDCARSSFCARQRRRDRRVAPDLTRRARMGRRSIARAPRRQRVARAEKGNPMLLGNGRRCLVAITSRHKISGRSRASELLRRFEGPNTRVRRQKFWTRRTHRDAVRNPLHLRTRHPDGTQSTQSNKGPPPFRHRGHNGTSTGSAHAVSPRDGRKRAPLEVLERRA